jgi:hypothetical protein
MSFSSASSFFGSSYKIIDPIFDNSLTYVDSSLAKEIDIKLMSSPGFSIDQLMELAGFSVASAANDFLHSLYTKRLTDNTIITPTYNWTQILIFCGNPIVFFHIIINFSNYYHLQVLEIMEAMGLLLLGIYFILAILP